MKTILSLFACFFALCAPQLMAATMSSGEAVQITIKGVPDSEQGAISGEYVVSSGGLLYMPMLNGGIKAAGSSTSTVARRIEAAYKSAQIYSSPRITLITTGDKKRTDSKTRTFITVAGHVKRPGPVAYTEGMTIYEVVAAAGDASTFGAMNRVEIIRNGKKFIRDLKKTVNRRERVQVGDVITVPEKNWRGR